MFRRSTSTEKQPVTRAGTEEMPGRLAPMLATLASLPADESAFAFEYKWDGIRAVCFCDGTDLRLQSRNLLDMTHRYPELWKLSKALRSHHVILDGEIVSLDEHGQPRFNLLQRRLHVKELGNLAQSAPVIYMVFDLLYLDGRSLLKQPYPERRRLLEKLELSGGYWQTPPSYPGEGHGLLSAATQSGLEGIVAKRLTSLYEPGRRSRDWLKIKVTQSQELVIGGWIPGQGGHTGLIGSLLMGYYEPGPAGDGARARLQFAGGVGTGFNQKDHRELLAQLRRRQRATSPFQASVPKKDAHWVKPDLVAEIEFLEWTPGGSIRHPSFKGLRPDKDAREVVRERIVAPV